MRLLRIKGTTTASPVRQLLATLWLTGGLLVSASAQDIATTNREWVNQPVSSQFANFQSIALYPHPTDQSILAAYCVNEGKWRGHMRVFKHEGDKIEWAAVFPEEYIEQIGHYVVSCRWKSFSMLKNPVLELVDSTHMGNGALWLLELDGKEFRVLLNTAVKGGYWAPKPEFQVPPEGKASFNGDHLTVNYRKAPGEKFETVVLTGSVSITDMSDKELPSKPFYQEFTWDKEKHVFIVHPPTPRKAAY